eukprot:gene20461-22477_t
MTSAEKLITDIFPMKKKRATGLRTPKAQRPDASKSSDSEFKTPGKSIKTSPKNEQALETPKRQAFPTAIGRLRKTPRRIAEWGIEIDADSGPEITWDNNSPSPSQILSKNKNGLRTGKSAEEISDLIRKLSKGKSSTVPIKSESFKLFDLWMQRDENVSGACSSSCTSPKRIGLSRKFMHDRKKSREGGPPQRLNSSRMTRKRHHNSNLNGMKFREELSNFVQNINRKVSPELSSSSTNTDTAVQKSSESTPATLTGTEKHSNGDNVDDLFEEDFFFDVNDFDEFTGILEETFSRKGQEKSTQNNNCGNNIDDATKSISVPKGARTRSNATSTAVHGNRSTEENVNHRKNISKIDDKEICACNNNRNTIGSNKRTISSKETEHFVDCCGEEMCAKKDNVTISVGEVKDNAKTLANEKKKSCSASQEKKTSLLFCDDFIDEFDDCDEDLLSIEIDLTSSTSSGNKNDAIASENMANTASTNSNHGVPEGECCGGDVNFDDCEGDFADFDFDDDDDYKVQMNPEMIQSKVESKPAEMNTCNLKTVTSTTRNVDAEEQNYCDDLLINDDDDDFDLIDIPDAPTKEDSFCLENFVNAPATISETVTAKPAKTKLHFQADAGKQANHNKPAVDAALGARTLTTRPALNLLHLTSKSTNNAYNKSDQGNVDAFPQAKMSTAKTTSNATRFVTRSNANELHDCSIIPNDDCSVNRLANWNSEIDFMMGDEFIKEEDESPMTSTQKYSAKDIERKKAEAKKKLQQNLIKQKQQKAAERLQRNRTRSKLK